MRKAPTSKALEKRAAAGAARFASTNANDMDSGFDYVFEDAVTIKDTGKRSVRAVVVDVDGKPGVALYSTSKKAITEMMEVLEQPGHAIAGRPLRRPTRDEMASFIQTQGPRLLPGVVDDDDEVVGAADAGAVTRRTLNVVDEGDAGKDDK